jgi:predicted nucleotidyltransferase
MDTEKIKREISKRIRENFKVKEIILFGSYARGNEGVNSDIDLIVILDEVRDRDFSEMIFKTNEVRMKIVDLIIPAGLDLIVLTSNEWDELLEKDGFFKNEVFDKGVLF